MEKIIAKSSVLRGYGYSIEVARKLMEDFRMTEAGLANLILNQNYVEVFTNNRLIPAMDFYDFPINYMAIVSFLAEMDEEVTPYFKNVLPLEFNNMPNQFKEFFLVNSCCERSPENCCITKDRAFRNDHILCLLKASIIYEKREASEGWTLDEESLLSAIKAGATMIVKFIIEHKIPSAKRLDPISLSLAVVDVIEILHKAGRIVLTSDLLDLATKNRNFSLIKYLLENGCRPSNGAPYMYASNIATYNLFLDAGLRIPDPYVFKFLHMGEANEARYLIENNYPVTKAMFDRIPKKVVEYPSDLKEILKSRGLI